MQTSFYRFFIILGLILLAAVACFPGDPAATPTTAEPAVQSRATAPVPAAPNAAPPATAVLPTATPAPTALPETPTREAPTASAEPDPTVTAGESASAAATPAIFEDLTRLEERAFSYLRELAVDVGVRTGGTDLEEEAAEFLVGRLEELGYSPEVQEFSWTAPTASLSIESPASETLEVNTLRGAASGEATAELVFVGLARPEDLPEAGLEGRIALIERGEITFGSKVVEVRSAGAVGAIIFNNGPGNFRGTLGGRAQIPAVALSQADGQRLKEMLNRGETVAATVAVKENAVPSRNVIAELPGTDEGVVVIGAHYDTVPDSIGASDNSSGMGALLAVAEEISEISFPFTVRFIAFGAEETGLHGSEYYVEGLSQAALEEIYLMINLDSVGSGARLVASGDRWVISHVRDTAEREDIAVQFTARDQGGSDHANFRNAWVPTIFFRADDLSRINTPADTMEHVNRSLPGQAAALVLDLLENVDTLPGYGQ
jgi:aminopeptidase YwaD